MWDAISAVMNSFNDFLWGWFMIILLLGTHIFLTIRTKFVQRKTFKAIKLSVTKDPDSDGDISPFQALATALASTIGTGNIIGVGTAIALGGPGAVLWCWLTGVFGIATKYSESLIGVKYRVKTSDGRMLGGAMYALERGFKFKTLGKILAVIFALFALLASFGIGSGVQVNAISNIMNNTFDLGTVNLFGQDASVISIIVGVLVAAITAVVIFGGIKSISRVCELLVPFMAVFYVLGCLIILGMNFDVLGIAAFAYSTILGWSYYGERCVEYLFGRGGMIPYKLILYLFFSSVLLSSSTLFGQWLTSSMHLCQFPTLLP